jgi:hypothetical protein
MRLSAASLAIVLLAGVFSSGARAQDIDEAFQRHNDGQTKNDPTEIKKLAAELHERACAVISTPAPQSADEKEAWNSSVANAKNADVYSEYALFALAIQSQPAVLVDLMQTLEQQNPKSKYLDQGYGQYLAAIAKTGGTSKVPAMAEKALVNLPDQEDCLLIVIDTAMTRKQPDRALTYANRLIAALGRKKKPDMLTADGWEKKRSTALGHGYWAAGVLYGEKGNFMNSDKNLRSAIPLIKGNDGMMGPALFYLGVANYNLGKMTNSKQKVLEGASFSQQAALIESPYTEQARHNALVMKAEGDKMR